jgi:hypothetical protein
VLYREFFTLTRYQSPAAIGEALTWQFVEAFKQTVPLEQMSNCVAYLLRVTPPSEHHLLQPLVFTLQYHYYPVEVVSTEYHPTKLFSVDCLTITTKEQFDNHMKFLVNA